MRINITLDKEQKISQATLDALEAELLPQSSTYLPKDCYPNSQGLR